jgi:nucleotide-binding universal stress UspA family protein
VVVARVRGGRPAVCLPSGAAAILACRAVMSFVGLGSVSDYVVGHVDAPVAIVKQ